MAAKDGHEQGSRDPGCQKRLSKPSPSQLSTAWTSIADSDDEAWKSDGDEEWLGESNFPPWPGPVPAEDPDKAPTDTDAGRLQEQAARAQVLQARRKLTTMKRLFAKQARIAVKIQEAGKHNIDKDKLLRRQDRIIKESGRVMSAA